MTTPSELVDVVQFLDRLAALPRTGWLLRGVTDPESIAEHSLGVAVVASLLVDDLRERGVAVDGEKVLRMALVHDAAEAFTGDIPMPAKTPELKAALVRAEDGLLANVLTPAQLSLWREVEAGATIEARVIKAADKLQMTIKALTYVQQGRGRLDEFFAKKSADLDLAREAFAEIERRRADASAAGA
jgi:putative hydrolase of HD superfamily